MPFPVNIHLAIAFDNNYLAPFYALAASILENNTNNKIIIHSIISGLSDNQKVEIKKFIASKGSEIFFYSVDESLVAKFVLGSKWTSAVYFRLFFPALVPPSVERLLYLDTDILVLKDLRELYQSELGPYPVGAVYDNWVKTAAQLGISEEGKYFNSGVLLIDVKRWKEGRVSENAFNFLNKYPEKINFVDQDALNAILKDNWQKLDAKFNFMYSLIPDGISKKELKKVIADKVVLHFTLHRPWHLLCKNRYRFLYFYFLQQSPLRNERKVVDFEIKKLPELFKIRLVEFYCDSPDLQKVWRSFKRYLS